MSGFWIHDFAIAYLGVAAAVAITVAVLADQFSTGRPASVSARLGLSALSGLLWPLVAVGAVQLLAVVATTRWLRGRAVAGTPRRDPLPAALPTTVGPAHRSAQ